MAGTLVSGEGFAMIPLEALAASAVLELVAAALLRRGALRIRGADAAPSPSSEPPAAWRYLLGLGVGALLVGGLVTPALAATEAGDYAQPHGGHQGVGEPGNVEPGDPVGSIPPAQHSGH